MSQKRQQEDGKARAENCPEDKRRKGHTFKKLVAFFLFDFLAYWLFLVLLFKFIFPFLW